MEMVIFSDESNFEVNSTFFFSGKFYIFFFSFCYRKIMLIALTLTVNLYYQLYKVVVVPQQYGCMSSKGTGCCRANALYRFTNKHFSK
ncbi:hypothetical protein BpHYR1_019979 [Brachionus plicatilis]|uniref:Uncharacterized protein n=1 Tax=Brachionus plicatilis TaxID=10195 RepID=A0A3M7SBM9_BRAPC|nr:hypothetical protein BpHYR1_019979 [Brachionus plicatilis]